MKNIILQIIIAFVCIAMIFVIKMLSLPALITAVLVVVVSGILIYSLAGGFSARKPTETTPTT
ncbi:MAG TPA: hypothetical protein PLT09_01055 [Deltaproteobacteria bacterium]|nr:hypothetical protein [Deltaproteobacteria bacterium]HPR53802.1 hypothetical protein [Deltaproteobacteria bacterium]HXK45998.1 hypothetical protein [Deltaproteobacteria bacterium]